MRYHELIEHEIKLTEAKETKVKDKVDLDNLDFADPTSKGELGRNKDTKFQRKRSNDLPGRKAGSDEAWDAIPPANFAAAYQLATNVEDDPEEINRYRPIRTANSKVGDMLKIKGAVKEPGKELMPINQLPLAVKQDTGRNINITWHAIPSLPHYAITKLRTAFRPLFNQMLHAELEDIHVATDMPGGGSSKQDIDRLWNFLLHKGKINDTFELDAFGIDPRVYHIDESHIVEFGGNTFLLLDETHPNMNLDIRYIYVSSGTARTQNKNELTGQKRLTRD